ncbi:MAG: SLBB domain-containing protein [Fibromonadaceae bacterium]|jgi:protein involved in polysaccharide export with SLBB domain|nr:SLBB domain-containing protein [Fibromonadaceae bacterium]
MAKLNLMENGESFDMANSNLIENGELRMENDSTNSGSFRKDSSYLCKNSQLNVSLCILIIIMVQTVSAQMMLGDLDDSGLQSLIGAGQARGMGAQPSMAEMLYIQQMLGQERRGSANLFSQRRDTSNLFIGVDSAIGAPIFLADTMSFVMVIDTIAIDSLHFYNDIEELRKLTPDGKKRVVLRKKRVPRSMEQLQRYESIFFKSANPSIFSGVTSGVSGNYPLKPGDELVLTIWGGVEKESHFVINNQGMVNVESVGMVSLSGTTLAAAEGILKTRLSRVYSGINRGQTFVNLRLENLSPLKVFLLGEVEKPGAYVFHGNTTVFQALYMAGGPNSKGTVRSVQVARGDSIFNIDLYDYLMYGKNTNRATLFDGDVVFLSRAKILAEIDGSVGRPAIYELKEGEGVTQLIAFASGINPDAAEQNMILRRIFPDGRMDYKTISKPSDYINGEDTLSLQNGDAIMVFKSAEKSILNTTILGAIKYPGTYQLNDNMTATDLIQVSGGLLETGYSGRVHILRAVPKGGYQLFSQNLGSEKSIALEPRDTLVVYSLKEMFRSDSVSIGGAVSNPGYYLYYEGMDAKDLVLLAGGYLAQSKKNTLSIGRLSQGDTIKTSKHAVSPDYDDNKDSRIKLLAWDHVEIPYDSSFYRPELVVLSGAFRNPGVYSLSHPEETLQSLIKRTGGFTDEAYTEGTKFFRRSMLAKDSLKRDTTLGLVGVDISRSMKKENRNNIKLMDGDSIHIPQKAISVRVRGEVGLATNVLWRKGAKASWYVEQAGGVKLTGDKDRVMIKYANGSVALASKAERDPDPGSEVFVPYKRPPDDIQWTQIVSAFGTVVTAVAAFIIAYAALQ